MFIVDGIAHKKIKKCVLPMNLMNILRIFSVYFLLFDKWNILWPKWWVIFSVGNQHYLGFTLNNS